MPEYRNISTEPIDVPTGTGPVRVMPGGTCLSSARLVAGLAEAGLLSKVAKKPESITIDKDQWEHLKNRRTKAYNRVKKEKDQDSEST